MKPKAIFAPPARKTPRPPPDDNEEVEVKRLAPPPKRTADDDGGKRKVRCRKKAKATKMAATDGIPVSFRTPDPIVVSDYWVMYALPQKALFRDLLHLSADELEKIDGFDAAAPAVHEEVIAGEDPFKSFDLSDMANHFLMRPLTPPPAFEDVEEMREQDNDALLQEEMRIVEDAQSEINVLREQNYRIKKEMATDVKQETNATKQESKASAQLAIEDSLQRVSSTAQSKLFTVAAQRYEKERVIVSANEAPMAKRKVGNEKKAAILSYVERNLGSGLRHVNSTQKLVLEVEIPKAVEAGGGVDGAVPEDNDDLTPEQRAKLEDFQRRLHPTMQHLKSQSTIKATITKRATEVRSVIRPLTRHLPQTKNNYVLSGEYTKQKRAEKLANARSYSKTGKHITDYQVKGPLRSLGCPLTPLRFSKGGHGEFEGWLYD